MWNQAGCSLVKIRNRRKTTSYCWVEVGLRMAVSPNRVAVESEKTLDKGLRNVLWAH